MNIGVVGNTPLAQTIARAAELRGLVLRNVDLYSSTRVDIAVDIAFAAVDVIDHGVLGPARDAFRLAAQWSRGPVVLVSQVPPGTTRDWAQDSESDSQVFYQVDTLIMSKALSRAYAPEQIIIGCADVTVPLPLAYQEYLMVFDCPVLRMSYESAEMAKCAINYVLVKQIEAANELSEACAKVGADYAHVRVALHNDARIGKSAYLHPGKPNQHLMRDVETVRHLRAMPQGDY